MQLAEQLCWVLWKVSAQEWLHYLNKKKIEHGPKTFGLFLEFTASYTASSAKDTSASCCDEPTAGTCSSSSSRCSGNSSKEAGSQIATADRSILTAEERAQGVAIYHTMDKDGCGELSVDRLRLVDASERTRMLRKLNCSHDNKVH